MKKRNQKYPRFNSDIFTEIYKKNAWGGERGEFYSGPGSYHPKIDDFTNKVAEILIQNGLKDIIEIGCGDFNVTSKLLKLLDDSNFDYQYRGYDVVKDLINRNNKIFGNAKIKFQCKDASVGTIKSGDVLLVRQVLQHLSNKEIKKVCDKFKNYKYVVVTEHQPSKMYFDRMIPNMDKPTDASIRVDYRSGVYLELSPFNCKIHSLMYSIPAPVYGMQANINTFLLINQPSTT